MTRRNLIPEQDDDGHIHFAHNGRPACDSQKYHFTGGEVWDVTCPVCRYLVIQALEELVFKAKDAS